MSAAATRRRPRQTQTTLTASGGLAKKSRGGASGSSGGPEVVIIDDGDCDEAEVEVVDAPPRSSSSSSSSPPAPPRDPREFVGRIDQRANRTISSFFGSAAQPPAARPPPPPTPLLPPGVVLVRRFLNLPKQLQLIAEVQSLHELTPLYIKSYSTGFLHYFQLSIGLHWSAGGRRDDGHGYTTKRVDFDGLDSPLIPSFFHAEALRAMGGDTEDVRRAVDAGELPFTPRFSSGLVNFYPHIDDMRLAPPVGNKVNLSKHADTDESHSSIAAGLPVLSLSVGDSAVFRLFPTREMWGERLNAYLTASGKGSAACAASSSFSSSFSSSSSSSSADEELQESDLAVNVKLESGDLIVFGGRSRLVYHAVDLILYGDRPAELREKMREGRLNVTLRCDRQTLVRLRGGCNREVVELDAAFRDGPAWRRVGAKAGE